MGIKKTMNLFRKQQDKENQEKAYRAYEDWILEYRYMIVSKIVSVGPNLFQLITDMIKLDEDQFQRVKEEIEKSRLKKSGLVIPDKKIILSDGK